MTRLRALGALLVVLAVLVVGGAASTVAFNQLNGPEQAVLDYASLLADGRAADAADRVPPVAGRAGVVVPALVSDTALARATTRLRPLSAAVENGRPEGEGVPVGQIVTVDLTYGLGQRSAVYPLHVRREPDGFPFTHKWTVLDPLLVPVVVQSNLPSLAAPSLAGVTLPVTGASTGPAPTTGTTSPPGTGGGTVSPMLVYPGIYPLTTPSYPLLTATLDGGPPELVAVHGADARTRPLAVTSPLTWRGSTALQAQVASGVVTDLSACVTAGRRMNVHACPAGLYRQRSRPDLTNDVTPSGLVLGDVSRDDAGYVHIAFTYSTPAGVRWTGPPSGRADIPIGGVVRFLPSDDEAKPVLLVH